MDDPAAFDDTADDTVDGGPHDPPVGPGRGRRIVTVAIVGALVVSMVFLAFISGRGVVTTPPETAPRVTAAASLAGLPRLAVVGADARLVTMDAMGGAVTPLGRSGIKFSFPAWSPDGSRIAVIGTTSDETGIYVFPAAGSGAPADPVVIYHSPDRPPFYLYWSPDGRRVSFLTTEASDLALRVAPADASAPATVVRTGSPLYWAWEGSARLLVHGGTGGQDVFFGEVDPDGTVPEPSAGAAGQFRAPAVSADARFRGYTSPATATPERVIVESADRTVRHGLGVYGTAALDFGPVGTELAFIAASTASPALGVPIGPLRLMEAASGSVRTLLPDSVLAFFWSPDGTTIAALQLVSPGSDQVAGTGGIVLARSTGTGGRPVTAAAAPPGAALRLVFVTVGSGAILSQRTVRLSDLFVEQVLPFFDQYALSHRLWAPDGASVVVPVVTDDGTVHLTTVRADGTDTRVVTDGAMAFWRPTR